MLLVERPHTPKDQDRILDRRLRNLDRLEPALECGVPLDVLAILVERGRADRLELAARQRRLQDVCRVNGTLGRARANERVELIDKENRLGLADLIDDLLQTLFEFTSIFRSGHQRSDVQ